MLDYAEEASLDVCWECFDAAMHSDVTSPITERIKQIDNVTLQVFRPVSGSRGVIRIVYWLWCRQIGDYWEYEGFVP